MAPGQLTLKQMKSIYDVLGKNAPEINDYNSWKDRQEFDDIMSMINTAKG
jgi:hypothetical protein